MAAIHVVSVCGDPCGAVRWTAVQRTAPQGSPRTIHFDTVLVLNPSLPVLVP